jgi:hypothetical protein
MANNVIPFQHGNARSKRKEKKEKQLGPVSFLLFRFGRRDFPRSVGSNQLKSPRSQCVIGQFKTTSLRSDDCIKEKREKVKLERRV